jgi:hypothetical protein
VIDRIRRPRRPPLSAKTIRESEKIGSRRVALTNREHVKALERGTRDWSGRCSVTLRDLRSEGKLGEIQHVKVTKDMLDIAKPIVTQKAGRFEPDEFEDQYEAALVDLTRALPTMACGEAWIRRLRRRRRQACEGGGEKSAARLGGRGFVSRLWGRVVSYAAYFDDAAGANQASISAERSVSSAFCNSFLRSSPSGISSARRLASSAIAKRRSCSEPAGRFRLRLPGTTESPISNFRPPTI